MSVVPVQGRGYSDLGTKISDPNEEGLKFQARGREDSGPS